MICDHCRVTVAKELRFRGADGMEQIVYDCAPCRRRLLATTRGLRWQKLPGYCPDCKTETWRFVADPAGGPRIPLWPKPSSLTAQHWTAEGVMLHGTFCEDCCPEIGAAVCAHVRECGDESGIETGGVVGHERSSTRYTAWFTDQFGAWLSAHARDYLKLDENEHRKLMALWEEDRRAVGNGAA